MLVAWPSMQQQCAVNASSVVRYNPPNAVLVIHSQVIALLHQHHPDVAWLLAAAFAAPRIAHPSHSFAEPQNAVDFSDT